MNNLKQKDSLDVMLDALADVQRRRLLVALLQHNPQDDSPAIIEEDTDSLDALISMRHVHLPKLQDYGFIDWNRETHEVTKGPNFDQIRPLLELLDNHGDELPPGWLE